MYIAFCVVSLDQAFLKMYELNALMMVTKISDLITFRSLTFPESYAFKCYTFEVLRKSLWISNREANHIKR